MTDRPPFDPAPWAMALLAVLVIPPSISALVMSVRCAIWLVPECLSRPWVGMFRDWLTDTIPVLVALIVARQGRG